MGEEKRFRCFLIGADNLLVECAELLRERGHEILGVISDTDRLAGWSRRNEIRSFPVAGGDWKQTLAAERYDYLFAITHLSIIPDEVLATPSKLAINFHDGPLPRYAGLNTPAWALINRETRYGISWHVIAPGVDTGDLLEQRMFDVAAQETSLSINTRCFEEGLEGFRILVPKLETETFSRTEQDTTQRSVFLRVRRPPAACVLDFGKSAEEIEALVRALDFGPYPNPLGAAKILRDGVPWIVSRAEALEPIGEVGRVLEVREDSVVVACEKGSVALSGFRALSGEENTVQSVGVGEGDSIQSDKVHLERWTDLGAELAKHEPFWVRRLRRLEPIDVPYAEAHAAGPEQKQVAVAVPAGPFSDRASQVAAAMAFIGRLGQKSEFHVAYRSADLDDFRRGGETLVAGEVPLRVQLAEGLRFSGLVELVAKELTTVEKRKSWLFDVVARTPELQGRPELDPSVEHALLPVAIGASPVPGTVLSLVPADGEIGLYYDPNRLSPEAAQRIARQFEAFLRAIAATPDAPLEQLSLLSEEERKKVLHDWNATAAEYDGDRCVHQLFETQVDRTPDRCAVVFEGHELTYRELDERANQLAHRLRKAGVGPDALVGVYVERSSDLLVATLGVQKAGGAYVPLDPAYPADRVAFMIEDSEASVIVAQPHLDPPLGSRADRRDVDVISVDQPNEPTVRVESGVQSDHLAYVIYTSGSTGKPKGVLVEHRNVANFFRGMEDVIPHEADGEKAPVWLAVTSLSFDISVLELFWTLSRGFTVVVQLDRERSGDTVDPRIQNLPMAFGLFYWGNDDGEGPKKYEVLLEGAKFADKNGFSSVWTPERHFHAFGGPYPNPAVTGAAVAAVTENLDIRAGSCVVPLHHPIRVAEEWAVVDNMSNGRVGLSVASGWQPDDFVLRPENAPPNNKSAMFRDLETLRKLWRGEKVTFDAPTGPLEVVSQPRPVQKELPIWVTTAGNPETYRSAGEAGANVLTHLLGQSIEEVGEKIKVYRKALEDAGRDPKAHKVTLMLHTFVGADDETVRQTARQPMKDYLRSAVGLIKQYAWAFPAFKRPEGASSAMDVDLQTLSAEELDGILEFAFERYFNDSGLFGTVERCLERVAQLKAIGVDEIACLIDYGIPAQQVLEGLKPLAEVVRKANRKVVSAGEDHSIPALVERHGITHFQCTPSMARMLLIQDETKAAVGRIPNVMLGGEALPQDLASELLDSGVQTLTNMYGPTETTIWSSTHRVSRSDKTVPIGRPIANTKLYVLDSRLDPVPPGVPGELWIGGEGVVRGYHQRPELTQERFIQSPHGSGRLYRTGDLVRFRDDGVLEFMGRTDHQVKVRGYRIELGEIESLLAQQSGVREAVVVAREDTPGDARLVGYVVADAGFDENRLKEVLRANLPEYMVPSAIASLDAMPLTPNGKIDRKALPAPDLLSAVTEVEYVAPEGELQGTLVDVWRELLGRDKVGVDDNFFDIGGHSLLVVRMHRSLKERVAQPVALTDLYRFPTIRALASHLEAGGQSEDLKKSADRAAMRRDALKRRRGRA